MRTPHTLVAAYVTKWSGKCKCDGTRPSFAG